MPKKVIESFNDEDAFKDEDLDNLETYDTDLDNDEPWVMEPMEDEDLYYK